MITEIGIVAGEIWHDLDSHGASAFSQIVQRLGRPRDLVLMSMGWLAREGHVVVKQAGGDYQVELRHNG